MADQGAQGRLSPWLRGQRIRAASGAVRGRVLDFGCGSGSLASVVAPEAYVGYDPDAESVALARKTYPDHTFLDSPPDVAGEFDTVVSLAVIEHVSSPVDLLRALKGHLAPGGRVVLTTPHPRFEIVHTLGARVGLFSHDAHEEHEDLLDEAALRGLAEAAGLSVVVYRGFLLGANQLLVLAARPE